MLKGKLQPLGKQKEKVRETGEGEREGATENGDRGKESDRQKDREEKIDR